MKAAVLKAPNTLVLENISKPIATDDYVVVKVKACGICGSDVRYYKGENPWALHTLGVNLPNPPNIVLGHEWSGVVSDVKNEADVALLGKRVAILAFQSCGVCDNCRRGNYQLCRNTKHIGHGAGWGEMEYYPGGMADYCQIWNTHVCEIPDTMSHDEATILDPLSVAIHAITQSDMAPGEDVLVLGAGPIGACIAQASRAYGAYRVICTDIYDGILDLVKDLGVNAVVNTKKQEIESVLSQMGLRNLGVVFDTVGTAETQRSALQLLKPGGTLVNLVVNKTKTPYKLMDLAGEKRVISSANNRVEDFVLGIKLIDAGVVNAKKMITHRFSLDDVQKGFDTVLDKEHTGALKVVINP